MTRNTYRSAVAVILMAVVLARPAHAHDAGMLDKESAEKAFPAKPAYSPYAGRNFPTRPFFGDTHLHTGFSMDAGAFGARLTPRDAYKFARGEEITSNTNQPVKLSRPLDFLVVADHSDGMGFFPLLMSGDATLLATPQGRKWYDMIQSGKGAVVMRVLEDSAAAKAGLKADDIIVELEGEPVATATTRANSGWKSTTPTLRECKADFTMQWKDDDTTLEALQTAYLAGTTVELAILTRIKEVSGAWGPKGRFGITNFSRREPLGDSITIDVSVELAVFGEIIDVA